MSKIKFNPLSGDLEFATNEIQSSEALVTDNLLVGAGDNKVKPLANGEEGQVIVMSGGKPQWKTPASDTNIGHVESLPEVTREEGRVISYQGKVYVCHGGQWISHSEFADNLGGKPETHEENFVYQPTAADLSIKDGFAEIKILKGNTLVWNQLDKTNGESVTWNGLTLSWDNGVLTLNGTVESDNTYYGVSKGYASVPTDRKFYNKIEINGTFVGNANSCVSHDLSQTFKSSTLYFSGEQRALSAISTSTKYTYFGIKCYAGDIFTDVKIKSQLFDLTQMFEEDNEPFTVEEFEAMFPNDYYEYNEGKLISFDGNGIKAVGFNQWDEEWEVGQWSPLTGGPGQIDFTKAIRSKNYIPVIPKEKYYFKAPVPIVCNGYDENKTFVKYLAYGPANKVYRIPSGVRYIKICTWNADYGDTYNNDICIHLSHSGYRNGEYEPSEDYTLSFQDGKTISQLTGKLNGKGDSVTIFPDGLLSAGNAYDEITSDGKAIKRIDSVDLGTLTWGESAGADSSVIRYSARVNNVKIAPNDTTKFEGVCVRYKSVTPLNTYRGVEGISNNIGVSMLYIYDSLYTDAASLKTSLQGQMLYYELETPEVYELDNPINTSYEAYDFGTEEVLYNDDNEVNIPMKASIEYGFNAVDMIRNNYFNFQRLKDDFQKLNAIVSNIVRSNEPTS